MATVGTAYVQIVPSAQGIKGGIEDVLEPQMAPAGKRAGGIFGNAFGGSIGDGVSKIGQSLQNIMTGAGGSIGEELTGALGGVAQIGGAAMKTIGSAAAGAAKVGIAALGAGTAAVAGGIVALGKEAIASYADYEQLTGGVETLFGAGGKGLAQYAAEQGKSIQDVEEEFFSLRDAQNTVMENAAQAFKTAGMSQNEYMELAVQTGASLISSLGGDTVVASRLMDTAITDMADNVNKMGTSMESVQNAYKGFSKGNFQMLDNLALGYGGSTEEMQRLLDDAEKLSGVKFDISSYADIVSAIHVVQESMGVAGTTAKEAETTISGSVNQMKSAWSNLLTGMASGEDVSGLVTNLVTSAQTVLGNLSPIIEQAVSGIGAAVTAIIDSGAIEQGIDTIMGLLPGILSAAGDLVVALVGALISAGPQILSAAAELILGMVQGISENIPQILSTIGTLLSALWSVIVEYGPQLLSAGVELIVQLGAGILSAVGEVVGPMVQVAAGAIQAWGESIKDFVSAGVDVVKGIVQGIESAASQVWETLKGIVQGAIGKVKEFLGISSPSKVFAYFGKMIDAGFAKGIEDNVGVVAGAMDTLNDQTRGVQVGVQRAASSRLGIDSGLAGVTPGNLGQLAAAIVNGLSSQLGDSGGSMEAAIYIDGDRIGRAMLPYNRKWAKATPEVIFG